jgi:hypothetical protein
MRACREIIFKHTFRILYKCRRSALIDLTDTLRNVYFASNIYVYRLKKGSFFNSPLD